MEARAKAAKKESDGNEPETFEFTKSASEPQDFCDENSQELQGIGTKSQGKFFRKAIKYSDNQSAIDSLNFHAAFLDIDDLTDSSMFSSEALMSNCNSEAPPAQKKADVFGRNSFLYGSRTASVSMWGESHRLDEMLQSLEEIPPMCNAMLDCMGTRKLSTEQLLMGYTECDLSYLVC